MGERIIQTEIKFDVEPAPEPEPPVAVQPEPPVVEPVVEEIVPEEPTTVMKLKAWLDKVMKSVTE